MSKPDSTWMSLVSQRKLLPRSSRDSLTLRRWVLVKNFVSSTDSLSLSQSHPPPSQEESDPAAPIAAAAAPPYEYSSWDEEAFPFPDWDFFIFPDASTLEAEADADAAAEAAWLDNILDELVDDDSEEEPAEPCATPVTDGLSSPAPAFAASAPPALAAPLRPVAIPVPSSSSSSSVSPGSTCNCTTPPPTPTSVPSTPRLLDDLPFFAPDGVDDSSDDESEGPDTPLLLSAHVAVPSLAAAVTAEPAVVFSDPLSYFVYPTEPEPISTTTPSSLPLQECS
ncbi:hypothetical protein AURDEDRAFT_136918 [Auricularia subglabra TFB-10046 SS5]|nr:hypothetical protein AURDEDRAFT_136918 [Auricularia subglabra TFB-10046 SS5]